ncbi:MAG: hypothetical protein U0838_13780 [Chloroflexota bacterium]
MTSPNAPRQTKPVDYKGEPLDAGRGPGLGCFWIQMIVLAVSIIFTPLTVAWEWPLWVTVLSFVVTMALLLLTGQTMIFLLRIVAAGRSKTGAVRSRGRTPWASSTIRPGRGRRCGCRERWRSDPRGRHAGRATIAADFTTPAEARTASCPSSPPTSPSAAAATRSSSSS